MVNRYKKYKPPFDDRNKAGERICIMCGAPLDGRKTRWCGKRECFQKEFIRSGDQSAMRRWLNEREHGICQICGMDCKLLRDVVNWVLQHDIGRSVAGSGYGEMIVEDLRKLGVRVKGTAYCNFVTWEADHIIPLSEGGEHHEDNIRTLCIACHKAETKASAKRRSRTGNQKEFKFVSCDKGDG